MTIRRDIFSEDYSYSKEYLISSSVLQSLSGEAMGFCDKSPIINAISLIQ